MAAKAYLKARGVHPTYQALRHLLSLHFQAHRGMAHQRVWSYPDGKGEPGPIEIRHLWLHV